MLCFRLPPWGFLFKKDELKGVELCLRAAELGSAEALTDLSKVCQIGTLLKPDDQTAKVFLESGAKKGSTSARYSLGVHAMSVGSVWDAKCHWTLGALAGCQTNLARRCEEFIYERPCDQA